MSNHTRHPLYITLVTNYDYKNHILSATNNVLLPLPALHFQFATHSNWLKLRQTKHASVNSFDGGISVLNHSMSWSKFINTHLYRQWFNIAYTYRRAILWKFVRPQLHSSLTPVHPRNQHSGKNTIITACTVVQAVV